MNRLTDLQLLGPHFDKKWIEQQYYDFEEQKQLLREERNALEVKQRSFDEDRDRFKQDKQVLGAERRFAGKQRQKQEEAELASSEERAVLDRYQQSLRHDLEQNLVKEEDLIRDNCTGTYARKV